MIGHCNVGGEGLKHIITKAIWPNLNYLYLAHPFDFIQNESRLEFIGW